MKTTLYILILFLRLLVMVAKTALVIPAVVISALCWLAWQPSLFLRCIHHWIDCGWWAGPATMEDLSWSSEWRLWK